MARSDLLFGLFIWEEFMKLVIVNTYKDCYLLMQFRLRLFIDFESSLSNEKFDLRPVYSGERFRAHRPLVMYAEELGKS